MEQQKEGPFFVIEACRDCKSHIWHNRHDEAKYLDYFNRIAGSIVSRVPSAVCLMNQVPVQYVPFDLYCNLGYNSDPNCKVYEQVPRVGAFEVSFKGHLIFSKLQCSQWPSADIMAGKAEGIYDADMNGEDVTPFTVGAGKGVRRDTSPQKTSPRRRSPSPTRKSAVFAVGDANGHDSSQTKGVSAVSAVEQEPPVKPFQPDASDKLIETKPEPVVEAPVPEPVVETKPEPVVEAPVPVPVVETKPDPVVEVKPEPVVEVKPEPVVEKDPVYDSVKYDDKCKSACNALTKVLEIMAKPVVLKAHNDNYLAPDHNVGFWGGLTTDDKGKVITCENDKIDETAIWVIFPLDDGTVCLKHKKQEKNLQMISHDSDGTCQLDNANQLGFETFLLEWSDKDKCFYIECPHHPMTVQCTPKGVVQGDNNNRGGYEKWQIISNPEKTELEIDIHKDTAGLKCMTISTK